MEKRMIVITMIKHNVSTTTETRDLTAESMKYVQTCLSNRDYDDVRITNVVISA